MDLDPLGSSQGNGGFGGEAVAGAISEMVEGLRPAASPFYHLVDWSVRRLSEDKPPFGRKALDLGI